MFYFIILLSLIIKTLNLLFDDSYTSPQINGEYLGSKNGSLCSK